MTRILLITLFSLLATDAPAQSLEAILGARMSSNVIVTRDRTATEVQGHPYAHNVWAKGSFRTRMNNEYTDVDLKFDAYSNALVILYKADSLQVKADVVSEFDYVVGNQTYVFKNGFDTTLDRLTPQAYLMVLSEGTWSIYKEVKKAYKKSNFDPTYFTGNRFDWYEDANRYIVKSPDGSFSELRPTRRNLIRLFGEKGRQMDQYIRQRGFDLENDAHLSHIFEFASSLE